MAADNNLGDKSRRERRKEARLGKNKKKFNSWIQHNQSRKLNRKKLKAKDKRLHAVDDTLNMLNDEIPSYIGSLEGEEEEASTINTASCKKRKKSVSSEEKMNGEIAVDSVHRAPDLDALNCPKPSTSKTSKRKKTKFEQYLEMERLKVDVSAKEDLALELKLAKKLKVKDGKLRRSDDELNMLFEGIPSIIDSLGTEENTDAEEAFRTSLKSSAVHTKRRKKSSEQEPDAEAEVDTLGLVPKPKTPHGAEVASGKPPTNVPITEGNVKYVTPHLRSLSRNESEEYAQVRRRVRGLLNKLSESNVEAITGEMSTIFHSVGRSVGAQLVSEEVLSSCSGGPRGNEQYAATFAALVAGMACLVGIDFGAKLVASLAKSFEDEYLKEDNLSLRNLTLLLSYLYIFGVCSSDLIWDFMIMLSKRLTEVDVSTILTILQCSGMKLRSDDPSAMKNFIVSVQNRVTELKAASGQEKMRSKRMEFMLETICDIKNNKKKPKEDTVQHTRIKKWLEKLTVDSVLLRGLTWNKLLDPDKKGQWWLFGDMASITDNMEEFASKIDREISEAQKMLQLAAAQRMNTDARRAIFCIIMSGEDYVDAFEKLLRLDLPGKQDREIIRVLVECCLQEKVFNRYYCVLASKFCKHDKNHKITLQYCIWDHYKELVSMQLIRSMHLAKFVAEMLASFNLSLAVLKKVDLTDLTQLTSKRIMHFRMLFEAIFEFPDKLVQNIFTRLAISLENETLRDGIKFFIRKYVMGNEKSYAQKFKVAKKGLNNVQGVIL